MDEVGWIYTFWADPERDDEIVAIMDEIFEAMEAEEFPSGNVLVYTLYRVPDEPGKWVMFEHFTQEGSDLHAKGERVREIGLRKLELDDPAVRADAHGTGPPPRSRRAHHRRREGRRVTTAERCPVQQFTMLAGPQPVDPFEVYSEVGCVPPFWTDNPNDVDGFWVVTRYTDVRAVLQDADSFSSLEAFIPRVALPNPMLPTESDPPDTRKYRSILLPAMTPAKIDPLEPRMHAVCAEIIDSFVGRGSCDVIADFAARVSDPHLRRVLRVASRAQRRVP